MKKIYMDNAATTPASPEVLEAMMPYFMEHYGNLPVFIFAWTAESHPGSTRKSGRSFQCKPREILPRRSESDNWAIKGVMSLMRKKSI